MNNSFKVDIYILGEYDRTEYFDNEIDALVFKNYLNIKGSGSITAELKEE